MQKNPENGLTLYPQGLYPRAERPWGYFEILLESDNSKVKVLSIEKDQKLYLKLKDEFIFGLEDTISNTTKTFSLKNKKQEQNLIDALKISCRKYSKEKTGKKPFTNINIVHI